MEEVVLDIQKYIDQYLFEPRITWPKYEFSIRCYSRWAANEILNRIVEESMKLPQFITGREPRTSSSIIKEFIDEMDYYSELNDGKNQRIFNIAKCTAIDINIYIFERRKTNGKVKSTTNR